MTTPTTYPSAKQFAGIAKETIQGTAVTAITHTIPVASFKPKDDPVLLEDTALRGSMNELYGVIQGPQKSSWSMDGPVFLETLPHELLNIMGAVATTGPASSIYTHVASLLNSSTGQPPTHTVTHWQGLTATTRARTYAGLAWTELTLKGNPESSLIERSAKGVGYWSAAYPTSEPTPVNLPLLPPLAAWRVELGLGGTLPASKVAVIREWEITVSRKVSVQHTSQNSQAPYIIQRGPIRATGKFFFSKPSTEQALDYLRNNTQPQFQLIVSNGAAGASAQTMTIDINAAAFDMAEINTGDEAIGYDASFRAVGNTTNAGASGGYAPIKFTVTNAVATY